MKCYKFVLANVFIVSSWCFLKLRYSERINGTKCKLCICAQGYHTTNVSDYQRCSLSFRIERFSVQLSIIGKLRSSCSTIICTDEDSHLLIESFVTITYVAFSQNSKLINKNLSQKYCLLYPAHWET